MRREYDAVVVGAGGDGPVAAWRLADAGLDVLVLEAGPWHGNENWPDPHASPGEATSSSNPADLSGELLDAQFTGRELDMGPFVGKFRWGPADRDRPRWFRDTPGEGDIFQVAGVGGTTLHYLGNHPRAFPEAVDDQPHWPIGYDDLVPYYKENERVLPVEPAPTTTKERLFYDGAAAEGYDLLDGKNVVEPGYRPQPNAIRRPDDRLRSPDFDGPYDATELDGSTLRGHQMQGGIAPIGAPLEEKAKRATNVSYVPMALETGNVTIRPNAFVTDVLTETIVGTPVAQGVRFRDTWRGDERAVQADVTVLAAGAIETPRLWLNADLPELEWVGRGLTIHWPDVMIGTWSGDVLEERVGTDTIDPFVGPNSGARFDYPGVGSVQIAGLPPGITSSLTYATSRSGYAGDETVSREDPWDSRGRVVGPALKERMADYRRSIGLLILTDDRPHEHNRVTTNPGVQDEHGPVPDVQYEAAPDDDARRDELCRIGARILTAGGADHVHRTDPPPAPLHIHSTMAMGKVVDTACEAIPVDRLFVADHSVLPNSLGGPNPTNTGQAVAMRTADRILDRYFPALRE